MDVWERKMFEGQKFWRGRRSTRRSLEIIRIAVHLVWVRSGVLVGTRSVFMSDVRGQLWEEKAQCRLRRNSRVRAYYGWRRGILSDCQMKRGRAAWTEPVIVVVE